MVGPPFSFAAGGRFFMEATTIAVIILAVLFLGGMTGLMIFRNTPSQSDTKEAPTRKE
jgi:hypothetical protein